MDARDAEAQLTPPSDLARLAGQDIYGTKVGMLRRVELFRLGNAWGMNFPDGASKDFMLPYFKQLEAEGKNPLRPPSGQSLDEVVRAREVVHADESHSEPVVEVVTPDEVVIPPDLIQPDPVSEFEMRLLKTPHAQLKKICKLKGIYQERNDSKKTLVARILAAAAGA